MGAAFHKNYFHKREDRTMSKKTTTKNAVQEQKNVTTPDANEVRKTWLQSYCAPKNTAARIITGRLLSGATIADLKTMCREYAKSKGGKQQWGCKEESNSDIMSHFRWLTGKGYTIKQDEKTQQYKLIN